MLTTAWFALCIAAIGLAALALVTIVKMLVVGDRERVAVSRQATVWLATALDEFGALQLRPSPVYLDEPRRHRVG